MKKYLLLVLCTLAFPSLKAQTYTSGHLSVTVTDSLSHDSTTCEGYDCVSYLITVDSSYAGDSVNIVDTAYGLLLATYHNYLGASPWSFNASLGCSGQWDDVPPGGYIYFYDIATKVAAISDTAWIPATNDSLLITNPCSWSFVSGRVFIDYNSDCVFDDSDVGLYGSFLSFKEYLSSPSDSLGTWPVYSDTSGFYNITVQQSWMVNYTVYLPSYYAFIFPASPCFSGTSYTLTAVPYDTANFPLECSSNVDVQCGILSSGRVRLHRAFYMQPYVNNTGCDSESGQMTLVLDSRVNYDSSLSVHPADMVHGDTLVWNYSGLSNISSGAYWNSFFSNVYLTLDSSVVVGDTLCFRVYTNIPAADINPYNNDYTVCVPVVYSYDPNSKDVSPQGNISAGSDTLTYTIRFQNTGSDTAENISIIDTLDSHFNMHTLKILGASANMTPKWLAANVVEFNFNEINLPDSSTNEPASHGEVQFSIVTNSGTPFGTQIKNNAYIYFDLNPPVVTNTAIDTVTLPNYLPNVATSVPIKVYPNPTTDKIFVENLDGGEISLLNMNGSIIMKQDVAGSSISIDVSRLPGGVYMIRTVSSSNTATFKFTKE